MEHWGTSRSDYGPEIEALNASYLSDTSAQEMLSHFMDELEAERRRLDYMKIQQNFKRGDIRSCERSIARLENNIMGAFVNYALSEAALPDGSVVIDLNAASTRASTAFRPVRVRR